MPVPNPEYDPNWQEVYDYHAGERDRLMDVIRKFNQEEIHDEDRIAVDTQFGEHVDACLDTFRSRCKTVQEYAKWMFESFAYEEKRAESFGIPVALPDYEAFESMDQVCETWSKRQHDIREAIAEKTHSLPVGQPIDAFLPGQPVSTYWRTFNGADIYPGKSSGSIEIPTLVTAQQIDKKFNVAFMLDTSGYGASIVNYVEDCASAMFREALAHDRQQRQAEKSLWKIWRNSTEKELQPSDFRFFIHTPPTEYTRENFSEVKMDFGPQGYCAPKWIKHETIPQSVQSARWHTLRDAPHVANRLQLEKRD